MRDIIRNTIGFFVAMVLVLVIFYIFPMKILNEYALKEAKIELKIYKDVLREAERELRAKKIIPTYENLKVADIKCSSNEFLKAKEFINIPYSPCEKGSHLTFVFKEKDNETLALERIERVYGEIMKARKDYQSQFWFNSFLKGESSTHKNIQ